VTTVEVLEELIKLAQEIRSARERGEESGLSEDEIAFYDPWPITAAPAT
jgi:type I restriction enzyme, R subunit